MAIGAAFGDHPTMSGLRAPTTLRARRGMCNLGHLTKNDGGRKSLRAQADRHLRIGELEPLGYRRG
jgi:hypothetical protein